MYKPIIFATSSVARKRLLSCYHFKNSVTFETSDFDEDQGDKSTIQYCIDTAKGKANLVCKRNLGAIVVAFDTMILIDEKLIGKPSGKEDARSILNSLSGRTHQVITGMVIKSGNKIVECSSTTSVKFVELSNSVVEYYLESKEWQGKAGGYGIQGIGAMFVEKIDGCYCNVVGVPVSVMMKTLLDDFGVALGVN